MARVGVATVSCLGVSWPGREVWWVSGEGSCSNHLQQYIPVGVADHERDPKSVVQLIPGTEASAMYSFLGCCFAALSGRCVSGCLPLPGLQLPVRAGGGAGLGFRLLRAGRQLLLLLLFRCYCCCLGVVIVVV